MTTIFAVFPAIGLANSAPVVSNVSASQRADDSKLVDIYYNLADADGDLCTVWVVISDNGGATWTVPAMTFTGAVGANIAPGIGKHVVWDAGKDVPGKVSNLKARVYADDDQGLSQMVLVPAGSFPYQNTTDPTQWVYVPSFMIDKYEVTNQLYCQFLNNADPNSEHWDLRMEIARTGSPGSYSYTVNPGRENYPVRYVSYYDAVAFAQWLSQTYGVNYRLPTEQEWEKAAAWDPVEQHYYNFGFHADNLSCDSCNYGFYGMGFPYSWCIGTTTPVGHYNGTGGTNDADSYYGCYDITGNVSEWTSGGADGVRLVRGYCYVYIGGGSSPQECRNRDIWCGLSDRREWLGFRLVLQLE